jgi:hypothetical protein
MLQCRALIFAAVASSLVCAASAQAQNAAPVPIDALPPPPPPNARIEYQNLYYTDPTVAAPGAWLFGFNAEAWGIYFPQLNATARVSGTAVSGTATEAGWEAGGSAFIGYDNFLLQVTGLAGTGTANVSYADGLKSNTSAGITEVEVIGRYVFPSMQFGGVTPYFLAGYDFTETNTKTTDSTGFTFVLSGTSQLNSINTYNTVFAGLGALYEFTPAAGLRFDLEAGPAFGHTRYTNADVVTGADNKGVGVAGMSHLTLYWKLTEEWTAQVGAKAAGIANQNNGVQAWSATGGFVSLGYQHRF